MEGDDGYINRKETETQDITEEIPSAKTVIGEILTERTDRFGRRFLAEQGVTIAFARLISFIDLWLKNVAGI